jgi:hypothetical protein
VNDQHSGGVFAPPTIRERGITASSQPFSRRRALSVDVYSTGESGMRSIARRRAAIEPLTPLFVHSVADGRRCVSSAVMTYPRSERMPDSVPRSAAVISTMLRWQMSGEPIGRRASIAVIPYRFSVSGSAQTPARWPTVALRSTDLLNLNSMRSWDSTRSAPSAKAITGDVRDHRSTMTMLQVESEGSSATTATRDSAASRTTPLASRPLSPIFAASQATS